MIGVGMICGESVGEKELLVGRSVVGKGLGVEEGKEAGRTFSGMEMVGRLFCARTEVRIMGKCMGELELCISDMASADWTQVVMRPEMCDGVPGRGE